jgi:hypothetical protein
MRRRGVSLIIATFLSISAIQAADHSVEPIVSRIQRDPVQSSALATVGYSKRLHALEIEFRDGLAYRYLGVSPEIYQDFTEANSKARYYNQHIRGRYRCLRVKPKHAR